MQPEHRPDPGRRRPRASTTVQPPGSTFKMVTVSGVLQAGIATPHTVFPYATYATLDGVKLSNANGEECGGSLALAFAVSCNSVFAPLGVKLGAPRLVAMAERYGFNHAPGIPGRGGKHAAPGLTDPGRTRCRLDGDRPGRGAGERPADGDGRGHDRRRRAPTAADVRARRRAPTRSRRRPAPALRTRSGSLMIGVVREGTGTAAAIPGVTVAGKTGTAELGPPSSCSGGSEEGGAKEGNSGESHAAGLSGRGERSEQHRRLVRGVRPSA